MKISHCPAHPLNDAHANLCSSFSLFQKLVLRQKCFGRIEPHLPQRVLKEQPQLTDDFRDLMRLVYKDTTLFQDSCFYASLTQVSTCPVTALLACQKSGIPLEEQFIIHLIGEGFCSPKRPEDFPFVCQFGVQVFVLS